MSKIQTLTVEWENQLRQVERGELDTAQPMASLYYVTIVLEDNGKYVGFKLDFGEEGGQ